MNRTRLGQLLFYKICGGEPPQSVGKFTKDEVDELVKMLGYEFFVDCRPYGFLGLKDLKENKEVDKCYSD